MSTSATASTPPGIGIGASGRPIQVAMIAASLYTGDITRPIQPINGGMDRQRIA